jgi:predicted dithiol-disulfide oxidoreductase (DUF899 family)
MESPKIVSREEWFAARTALLAKEKEFTRQRGRLSAAEELITTYMVLDLTPKGRKETGPHHNLMDWVRRHDEYDNANEAKFCCAGRGTR